jgi:hypothetical protein
MLNALKNDANITYTENGALTHKSTMSALMDMFAMGAAMRSRSEADVIFMFREAFKENPVYALKCLFYIRDVRGGQGERRFFRLCIEDLARNAATCDAIKRNMIHIPEFGRWDDLYAFEGTLLEADAFNIIKHQLALDVKCKTPSLLAKWLKSENASSKETTRLGNKTRKFLGMTHKEYRKVLAVLRTRINVLEKLMSENRWEEIEFDKIPSKAGLIYKNAFARRDIIKEKYERFAKDENTKVNAGTLYPYEVVEKAINLMEPQSAWARKNKPALDNTDRLMINKYWNNLTDYFNGATFNALAMVDTSGSMMGTPMNVAVSLGLYCAERANGPFANHYISFSSRPQLIACEGVDFCDKVDRIVATNLCENTNIEAAFNMLLSTARRHHMTQEDLPQNIIVISDMEFDRARGHYGHGWGVISDEERRDELQKANTLMEGIAKTWAAEGYQVPHLIFWNVDARQNNIPMLDGGRVSFVSGFSPSIFQSLMTGKTGYDLMMEVLNKERYACIQ